MMHSLPLQIAKLSDCSIIGKKELKLKHIFGLLATAWNYTQ
jgi:hypothetical protein